MKDTTECLLERDHFEPVSNQSAHRQRAWIERQKPKSGFVKIHSETHEQKVKNCESNY